MNVINLVHGTKGMSFMNEPSVLISILNWNNSIATINCVNSVLNQDYKNFEILIVDNNSIKDSKKVLFEKLSDIKIIQNNQNTGYASGHKISLNYANEKNYKLLWILNNDTVVDRNALANLVKRWQIKNDAIYGSLILEEDGQKIRFGGSYPVFDGEINYNVAWNYFRGKNMHELNNKETFNEVADVNGASMLVGVDIIKKHGFMPEDYFLYCEETHYCYKLRENKISSYIVSDSIVVHSGSKSFSNDILKHIGGYYRKRNSLFFEQRFKKLKKTYSLRIFFNPKFFFSFVIKHLLFKCRLMKRFSIKHYLQQLAIWHFIINKKGKTIKPEDYI